MVEVHVERDLDFPAATVWALLEDFGDINWAPGIDKIEVIGEGIGMIRRLHLAGMEPIDEQLESMDANNMSFGYTIPRGIPMPVTDYSANAKVTAIDDGRCHVDWYGRATPQGASDEEAAAMIRGAYEMLLQWVDEHLKSRA
ncbi:SRPBCC family protein [Spongiibacter marinus]|jgi:carbon monoxide dehydrogenase subunit G|uniref:SRPBCC family protein n=1 Tax=Spongiibacter marinus TaxID=354246 RepID=UPI00042A20B7|nr:SRPBCC family protein [Spongiibacter marinus]